MEGASKTIPSEAKVVRRKPGEAGPGSACEDAPAGSASLSFLEGKKPPGTRETTGGGDSDEAAESLPFLDASKPPAPPKSGRRQAPRSDPEAAGDENDSQASSFL